MTDKQVPLEQAKDDILDMVCRVVYRGERIVLTSRGTPKAALVSVEDYRRLTGKGAHDRTVGRQEEPEENKQPTADISGRRISQPRDANAWKRATHARPEERPGPISNTQGGPTANDKAN